MTVAMYIATHRQVSVVWRVWRKNRRGGQTDRRSGVRRAKGRGREIEEVPR